MKTGPQLIGEATAQAIMLALRIRDTQFRRATPPRMHMRMHDRAEGPAPRFNSIHMLVRSVNKGFACRLAEAPHLQASRTVR